MDFEDIILSEITQKEKDKYCMISHVESKKTNKQTNEKKKQKQISPTCSKSCGFFILLQVYSTSPAGSFA